MSNYSKLAARRYRLYINQKERQALLQKSVAILLLILHALARALEHARIKKSRRVEQITVD
jgi:hypothetical protein